jgi:aspartyl/asparaginyl beta-hydroxylase (cupin superfamily)
MSDAREHAIRERAYAIWEQEGRPKDRSLANWLRAKAEVRAEQIVGILDNGKPAKSRPPAARKKR